MRIDGPQITGSFNLNGDVIGDLDALVTTSSLNTYTSSIGTTMGHVNTATHSLNTFTSSATTKLNSIEGVTGSYATTGSNLFVGTQTSSGSIVPSVNNTYDLGSPTHQFRHVYISSGSLYVNGTKVLGSTAQELQITTDAGQSFKILESSSDTITLQSADGNITLTSTGQGDIVMDPNTGVIGLKGTVTIYTGNKITSSDGNAIQFGNGIAVTGSIVATGTALVSGSSQITYSGLSGLPSNIISGSGQLTTLGIATTGSNTFNGNLTVTGFIDAQELRTTYISSSILYRSGSTKFGDELTDTHSFTGSILISGSISVPGSNLVSGSSQVLNGSGVFSGSAQLPSGIVSSSAQTIANLPSGVVSGSAQTIANLPSGTVSGSAQTIANLPSGTVSGSVQVDVMSTTNIARLATTGSNTFTSNQIVSGAFTTTGDINVNSSGIIINRNTSGEPYLFFRKDGVNRGSIYGITGGGLRMFDQSDNQVLTMTGSMIGINKSSPSGTLDVQSSGANGIVLSSDSNDTNNSGRIFLMRTGGEGFAIMNNSGNLSFRSNAIPGNTSGNERMKLDSSHNLILNNGLTVAGATNHTGAVRMNNSSAGNSPKITFGTEDESIAGNKSIYLDTYWMILQPHVNEGLRVRFVNGSGTQTETVRLQSTQASFYTSISSSSSISASGNMGARNFNNLVRSWSSNGSYVWHEQLNAIASVFDDGGLYRAFIRESNAAHYYGYMFDINVSSKGYGGTSLQYVVRNMTSSNGAWPAGCGATSFASIDNSGFTKQSSGCFDTLHLYITKIGG